MRTTRLGTGQHSAEPSVGSAPTSLLQRQCACGAHTSGGTCEHCRNQKGTLPLVAGTLRSPGQPLDREARAFMESRFQRDFSAVRVHADASAAASAQALHARAWTLGSHVAFAPGAFAPQTPAGRRLLAHELTHVVQQAHAPAPVPSTSLSVSAPGDAAEREAERVATRVGAAAAADASPMAVRAHSDPDVIHRDIDYGKLIGGALGFATIVGVSEYIRSKRKRAAHIEYDQCNQTQQKTIGATVSRARTWASKALDRVRALGSNPTANQVVRATLLRRFGGADRLFRDTIARVIQQVVDGLDPNRIRAICHTASETTCGFAAAWVGASGFHFCPAFFARDESRATVAVLHEIAHTAASGAPIGDRAYEGERRLRGGTEPTGLSGVEALTNAESYAECIADLATGQIYGLPAPIDQLDCPDDWKGPVRFALADAHRAAINMASELSTSTTPADLWRERWAATRIPGPAPSVDDATKAYMTLNTALYEPVHIVCKADPSDSCSAGDAEWQETPPTLSLCAAWKARGGRERTTSLLAAIFGWLAKIDKPAWRAGLAQIAVDTLTSKEFGPPKAEDVFSSAAARPGREAH